MTDKIFLRLSSKYALGYDDRHWIVFRSLRNPPPRAVPLEYGRGCGWEPVEIETTKGALLRSLREKGCVEAERALADYPSTFKEWKALEAAQTADAASTVPAGTVLPDVLATPVAELRIGEGNSQ